MDLAQLPALNAVLNAVAAALLLVGRFLARRRRIGAHRRVMIAAFCVSSVFLASYLVHKVGRDFENTPFHAVGAAKAAYLALLASHVVLAMAVPFLAITLIVLGLRGSFERHRRIARWAWPIWMYVSVSGVAIYVLLYHLNPAADPSVRGDLSPSERLPGAIAAAPGNSWTSVEKLSGFADMRGETSLENRPGVGYLPSGREAPSRVDLLAAPPSARRPDGYQALTRRPLGGAGSSHDRVSQGA